MRVTRENRVPWGLSMGRRRTMRRAMGRVGATAFDFTTFEAITVVRFTRFRTFAKTFNPIFPLFCFYRKNHNHHHHYHYYPTPFSHLFGSSKKSNFVLSLFFFNLITLIFFLRTQPLFL